MLFLKVARNQTVVIGNTVVELTDIKGETCKLGITAPENVSIVRSELLPSRIVDAYPCPKCGQGECGHPVCNSEKLTEDLGSAAGQKREERC